MVRLTLIARASDGLPLAEGLDSDKDPEIDAYKQQAKVGRGAGSGPGGDGGKGGRGEGEGAPRAGRQPAGPRSPRPQHWQRPASSLSCASRLNSAPL
jgi:hypothetical protein